VFHGISIPFGKITGSRACARGAGQQRVGCRKEKMRDCWYADKRDLVKWGVLTVLAKKYEARNVLQM